jgi:hypothetical protein
MKFTGQDNKSFELWVVNYQFRDNQTDEYDSNWLTIGIRLKGFKKEWITSDPSLLTWELKSLTDWFRNILAGNLEEKKIEFIEPNLKFELIDRAEETFRIRTHLTLESKPSWFTEDDTFSFDLVVDREELDHCVQRLDDELMKFPGRAGGKLD